jgi:hypothetical protein
MTWTAERRQQQSEAIRQWRPWLHSTGPRSDEGKAKVASNAYKGGHRDQLRQIGRWMADQKEDLRLHNEVMAHPRPPAMPAGSTMNN